MIKEIISSNINRFLNWKMIIVYAIYGVFCFYEKLKAINVGLNFFEYTSEVLCNQHHIVYFMVPVYFLSIMNFLTERSNFTMIRVKKYKNYFISKCISYFLIAFLFVFLALITLFIMGFGLSLKNEYAITLDYSMFYIGPNFIHIFTTPLILLLAQSLHMILGFTFLSIVSEAIYIFFNNRSVLLGILGVSFVFTVFSASGKLDINISPFLLNTYTSISNTPNFFIKTILTEIVVFAFLLFIVSKFWYKKIISFEIFKNLYINNWSMRKLLNKRFLLVVAMLLSIVNITLYLIADLTYFSDYISLQFIGYGYGYFNTLTFSALLITMCTPLFFQSYFLEEEIKNNSCFVKVRYGNRLTYLKHMLSSFFVFAVSYILLLFIIAFLECLIIGFTNGLLLNSENSGFFNMAFSDILLKALLLKCLELYMILLLSLAITIYIKRTAISFFVIISGYFLNIFDFSLNKYNPFGLSSTIRWGVESSNGISFLSAFSILCIANIILLTFLVLKGQKKII
jgi:hypothetical protein